MTALTTTRPRGRIITALGDDTFNCEVCKAEGRQYGGGGTNLVWILGRPAMRVCRPHQKEMQAIYEGAIGPTEAKAA